MTEDLREFLESVKEFQFEIFRTEARIQDLSAAATKCTTSWSLVPKGGSSDPHKDATMIALAEEKSHLAELKAMLRKREKAVDKLLSCISNLKHRMAMKLKYVDLLSLPGVEDAMSALGVSVCAGTIYYQRANIEAELQEMWDENKEELLCL